VGYRSRSRGWTNLTTFVSGVWTNVKDWFTGLFSWGTGVVAEGWTNLKDFAIGVFKRVKDWFTGLFSWGNTDTPTVEGETPESFSIWSLLGEAVDKVKEFFTNLFDFIPSLDEIKANLTSILPKWMRPKNLEEKRTKLLEKLAEYEQKAAEALPAAQQWDAPGINDTREDFEIEAAAIREALKELDQFAQGGVVKAPSTGAPVMVHNTEVIGGPEMIGKSILDAAANRMPSNLAVSNRSVQMTNVVRENTRMLNDAAASRMSGMMTQNITNVVQGGTTVNAPKNSIAIMNAGRRDRSRRPDVS